MSKPVYIYALTEPGEGWNIRYVGKTKKRLEVRLKEHLIPKNLRSKSHKNCWLKSLLKRGLKPDMILLDIGDEETWEELERFHIASHRASGFDLTNGTNGGDGAAGNTPSEETRLKRSLSMMGKKFGPWAGDDKRREQISIRSTGNTWCVGLTQSEEAVAKRRASMMGVNKGENCSPETRAKLSEAGKKGFRRDGMPHTDETKAKMAEGMRQAWARRKAAK